MTDTPELNRQRVLNQPRPPFEVLSDFWNWLEAQGLLIAEYGAAKQRRVTCGACHGRGFDPGALTPREQQLLRRGLLTDVERPRCAECDGTGMVWQSYTDEDSLEPYHGGPERLFAEFWGLDPDKIDAERQALLQDLQQRTNR